MQDLEKNNIRVWQRNTFQRNVLLEIIRKNNRHLDADELYRMAREKELPISLSTVYRNLRLFKKLGLIEERHLAQEHHHYEAKPIVEHHHLVCSKCGRVIEFTHPLADKLKQRISVEEDFLIRDIEIRMEGYCSECRQAGD